jgi:outer membrane biosynthesis protein TonB
VVTPVVARREEAAPPKPEEKPIVTKPAEAVVVTPPKKEEPVKVEPPKAEPAKTEPVKVEAVKVEPPKPEPAKAGAVKVEPAKAEPAKVEAFKREPVKVEPVKAEPAKAEPRPRAVVAAAVATPVERVSPSAEAASQPGFVSRFKWVIVAVVVLLAAGGGYFFFGRSGGSTVKVATVDTRLGLKVENSAGQLLLSWNRNAPLVAGATRGTLTINDGDHSERVDLDLATLHNGSVVYSAISNDVSFVLEVQDQKTGKSQSEQVRRLAGFPRPSPAVQASNPAPQTEAVKQPQQSAATNTARPTTVPVQPAPTTPAPVTPQVESTVAVTVKPAEPGSLARRLRAPEPADIGSATDSQSNMLAANAPNVGGGIAPPPPVPVRPAQPTAQSPRASTPAQPAPATATALRVGTPPQAPKVLHRSPAVYPAIARASHSQGVVRVNAVVGKNGKVKKATAMSGPQILRQSAADSVSKWIFSPAILDGEPVEGEVQVDVSFQM